MAIAKFFIGTDMRTFAGYDYNNQRTGGGGGSSNGTEDDVQFDHGFYHNITTTGFTTFYGLMPGDGTVTDWEFGVREISSNPNDPYNPVITYTPYWSFTGLSVPAADFSPAVQNDGATLAAYMPTMLAGNDTISASPYADYLIGYGGNDAIYGNGGNDTLEGREGADLLNGGPGADTMIGGVGNDTYIVDNIADKTTENASEGIDLVKSSITWTLRANTENLTLTGTAAINGTGNLLANVITGNGAANILNGGGANDTLHGEGGNDTLYGGAGKDTLDGGAGQDLFVFNSALNATTNVDTLTDFTHGTDQMVLDNTIFTAFTAIGEMDSTAFYAGTSAHDSDDHIIYDGATGNIYYDPDGTGSTAQTLFAHVTPGTTLSNLDFFVIT